MFSRTSEKSLETLMLRYCKLRGYQFVCLDGFEGYKTKAYVVDLYEGNIYKVLCSTFVRGKGGNINLQRLNVGIKNSKYLEYKTSWEASGNYPAGTKFTRSNKKDRRGYRAYTEVTCPVCKEDNYSSIGGLPYNFVTDNTSLSKGVLPCRCSPSHVYTEQEVQFDIQQCMEETGGEFLHWKYPYKNKRSIMVWRCVKGHTISTTVSNFINKGRRCRSCNSGGFDPEKTCMVLSCKVVRFWGILS